MDLAFQCYFFLNNRRRGRSAYIFKFKTAYGHGNDQPITCISLYARHSAENHIYKLLSKHTA